MSDLKDCENFSEYIDLLKTNAHKYVIIIAVKDAVEWTFDHSNILNKFCSIGLSSNLHNSKRKSFIAVIEHGKVINEQLAENDNEVMSYCNGAYQVISKGFSCGNSCMIKINGTDYAINNVGLNIAVWDSETNTLIDSVAVNMIKQEIIIVRHTTFLPTNYKFQLDFIHSMGYSLAMYAKENDIHNIYIYQNRNIITSFMIYFNFCWLIYQW